MKGHPGIAGNDVAGRMAGRTGWIGKRLARPDIAPPSIRQAYPIHSKPKYLRLPGDQGAHVYGERPGPTQVVAERDRAIKGLGM